MTFPLVFVAWNLAVMTFDASHGLWVSFSVQLALLVLTPVVYLAGRRSVGIVERVKRGTW